MKALAAAILLAAASLAAQSKPAPVTTPDPVVWAGQQIFTRQSAFMLAAADKMPAEKYGYAPTKEQMTFAHIIAHTTGANLLVCHLLSDTPQPPLKLSESAGKPELIAALKSSFDYCTTALANLHDKQLGDNIMYPRTAGVPRSRALVELTDDLEDHYSQMAMYLRLNGILPPSATPAKK